MSQTGKHKVNCVLIRLFSLALLGAVLMLFACFLVFGLPIALGFIVGIHSSVFLGIASAILGLVLMERLKRHFTDYFYRPMGWIKSRFENLLNSKENENYQKLAEFFPSVKEFQGRDFRK